VLDHPVVEGLYVHPVTKLLRCTAERGWRSAARYQRFAKQNPRDVFAIDAVTEYRQIEEIWYVVGYEWMDIVMGQIVWDAVRRAKINLPAGTYRIAVSKKQCNRKQLEVVNARLAERDARVKKLLRA
jgi:hypothetical protein